MEKGRKRQVRDAYYGDLPQDLQSDLMETSIMIKKCIEDQLRDKKFSELCNCEWSTNSLAQFCSPPKDRDSVGQARIYKDGDKYEAMIQITGHFDNHQNTEHEKLIHDLIASVHKKLSPELKEKFKFRLDSESADGQFFEGFDVYPDESVARDLWERFEDYTTKTITEEAYIESAEDKSARTTFGTLAASIISDGKKNKPVTKYTTDMIAKIITENFLSKWSNGFTKFSIILDDMQSFNYVEFKVPKMTSDFIERFIEGRETITGFLHRSPEIKMKISPRVFMNMKERDDMFKFFQAAVKYYDSGIDKYSVSLMSEVRKFGPEMKQLICTTKLSGIVTIPLMMLFTFDDVRMYDAKTFMVSKEDINRINTFVRAITTTYKDPEKEKSKIINDVKDVVKALHECIGYDPDLSGQNYFPEALVKLFNGDYDPEIERARELFEAAQVDTEWYGKSTAEVQYLQEKFGVKKLKKIPRDLVAYITIEAEAIKDANDKMMIASYCLGKLEIVEWYIELLDVGSKKYIVPHDKPYLQSLRTQLLACYKKIMDTPIQRPNSRPLIDIQYPKGYEG